VPRIRNDDHERVSVADERQQVGIEGRHPPFAPWDSARSRGRSARPALSSSAIVASRNKGGSETDLAGARAILRVALAGDRRKSRSKHEDGRFADAAPRDIPLFKGIPNMQDSHIRDAQVSPRAIRARLGRRAEATKEAIAIATGAGRITQIRYPRFRDSTLCGSRAVRGDRGNSPRIARKAARGIAHWWSITAIDRKRIFFAAPVASDSLLRCFCSPTTASRELRGGPYLRIAICESCMLEYPFESGITARAASEIDRLSCFDRTCADRRPGRLEESRAPGQIKVSEPRLDFLEATYGSKRSAGELTSSTSPPNPKEQKEGAASIPASASHPRR